jgi:hypothetical protein
LKFYEYIKKEYFIGNNFIQEFYNKLIKWWADGLLGKIIISFHTYVRDIHIIVLNEMKVKFQELTKWFQTKLYKKKIKKRNRSWAYFERRVSEIKISDFYYTYSMINFGKMYVRFQWPVMQQKIVLKVIALYKHNHNLYIT